MEQKVFKRLGLVLTSVIAISLASCSNDLFTEFEFEENSVYDTSLSNTLNINQKSAYYDIIKRYNLKPVPIEEITSTKLDIKEIVSPQQLESILQTVYAEKTNIEVGKKEKIRRIKTLREIGQNVVKISGSDSNGTASVYVDLNTPSVVNSTYHLGIMDAFIGYQHISGSASRNNTKTYFTAYGEGVIKIIFESIEIYKFSVEIEGNCKNNGNDGVLTKF